MEPPSADQSTVRTFMKSRPDDLMPRNLEQGRNYHSLDLPHTAKLSAEGRKARLLII